MNIITANSSRFLVNKFNGFHQLLKSKPRFLENQIYLCGLNLPSLKENWYYSKFIQGCADCFLDDHSAHQRKTLEQFKE